MNAAGPDEEQLSEAGPEQSRDEMLTDRQKYFEERVASLQHPAAEGTEFLSIPEEFAARSHTTAPGATLFPNTGWLGNCSMLVDDDVALGYGCLYYWQAIYVGMKHKETPI